MLVVVALFCLCGVGVLVMRVVVRRAPTVEVEFDATASLHRVNRCMGEGFSYDG